MANEYGFGDGATTPGLGKLSEECGEVVQVIGKIISNGTRHSEDGLKRKLEEEIADVLAAIAFVVDYNNLDSQFIDDRAANKVLKFMRWHNVETDDN